MRQKGKTMGERKRERKREREKKMNKPNAIAGYYLHTGRDRDKLKRIHSKRFFF